MSLDDPYALADPLEKSAAPERVNYATGVLLQAEDFRDEQTYHRGRLAAALRHLVGFGTLAGLAVRPPEEGDNELELRVEPGMALDRYGRLIELGYPYCIRLARWFAAQETSALRAAIHRSPRTPLPVQSSPTSSCRRLNAAAANAEVWRAARSTRSTLWCRRGSPRPELTLVLRAEGAPADIPTPENFWPAANASRDNKLKAVLGAFDLGLTDGLDEGPEPLTEHVDGENLSAVLLARIAIPVTLAADAPTGTRPVLDVAERTRADNSLRPFIFLPGKWLGRAPADVTLVEP